jgi:6-phosphofructo-2-kinase/fructose-2,6-biphosphatase 2/6-phosphofructo-2-kinase/fructose-2,6-biphosphatase 4
VGSQQDSSFFDPHNADAVRARTECAVQALNHLLRWFRDGGQVGIYDGTNTTRERRSMVAEMVASMVCVIISPI